MKKTILVVDDEIFITSTLVELLEKFFPNHDVVGKNTYPDGLEFAIENIDSIKLVILDGKLPSALGSEIGIAMRSKGSQAVICMLSGSPVEEIIPNPDNISLFDGVFEKGRSMRGLIHELQAKMPA